MCVYIYIYLKSLTKKVKFRETENLKSWFYKNYNKKKMKSLIIYCHGWKERGEAWTGVHIISVLKGRTKLGCNSN